MTSPPKDKNAPLEAALDDPVPALGLGFLPRPPGLDRAKQQASSDDNKGKGLPNSDNAYDDDLPTNPDRTEERAEQVQFPDDMPTLPNNLWATMQATLDPPGDLPSPRALENLAKGHQQASTDPLENDAQAASSMDPTQETTLSAQEPIQA